MKPTSIIGLIVAAVLIVAGLIICLISGGMASRAGVQLYSETQNGTTRFQEPAFTDDGITKIEISAGNVAVNVIGGCDTSYIELLNFDENYFSYTLTGKTITVKEMKDLTAILKFWENGFAFKGMRNVIWSAFGFGSKITGNKVINIYLSDTSTSLNSVDIALTGGAVSLKNLTTETDFVLTVGDTVVSAESIQNASKLEVLSSGTLELRIDNAKIQNFLLNSATAPLKNGTIVCTDCYFKAATAYMKDGQATLSFTSGGGMLGIDNYSFDITAGKEITMRDVVQPSPLRHTGLSPQYSFLIVNEKGSVSLS